MNKKFTYAVIAGLATTLPIYAAEKMESAAPVATVSAEEIEQSASNEDILSRLAALESKTSKSDWTGNIKFKGDLRYRYEHRGVDGDTDANRQRIRARIGAYATVNDFTTAGLRIRTGGDANSGNQTIGSDFDSKDIYLDLAYMSFLLNEGHCGSLTLGKMKYPWKVTTDMIWDSDVNPEGIAYNFDTAKNDCDLFGHAGYAKVQDTSASHDLNLISLQAGAMKPLNDSMKATAGASLFVYENATDFIDPDTGANYLVDYRIAELFAELSCKDLMAVPVKFYGNYVNNVEESDDSQGVAVGIKFADAKKGKWEAKVGLRRLEANAAPAYYADSDFAGGGTDIKGFRFKGAYNLAKHLQAGTTLIVGERISTEENVTTLHLDLIASF